MIPTLFENLLFLSALVFFFFTLLLETVLRRMIEIQGTRTALLLLVNTCILHQNNGTTCPSYINYCLKRRCFVAGYFQPVQINNYFKEFCHQIDNYGQLPLQIEDTACLPQNRHFLQ